jgi:acyl-CoA thioesterase I
MMHRFPGLFLPAVLSILLALNHTASATKITPESILVLGDSLSAAYGIDTDKGWVELLRQQLSSEGYDYNVINASVSGDTTRTGLGRIDAALQSHKPSIVIIALGGNDGLRGLAFSEIESSLAGIIEHCVNNNAKVLLAGVRLPPNYGAAYNKQFAELYDRLSGRYAIPLVPRLMDQVAEHRDLLQDDGIHPKAEAQAQIMRNVWAALMPMLEKSE